MTDISLQRSGKTHRDENFPVASWLIRSQHRGAILAFYNFVRAADDIADDPALTAEQKVARLDPFEEDLASGAGESRATALRRALSERNMDDRHALDLLKAFRLDATKLRYANWDELMAYCELSAMPVGRFVLDVHGESPTTWPASDAFCAALQIINHLQDCGDDYRALDRVYFRSTSSRATARSVGALGAARASPGCGRRIAELARGAAGTAGRQEPFAASIVDWRLGLEISVIQSLASRLAQPLARRDPLAEETHLGKLAAGALSPGRSIVMATARRVASIAAEPGRSPPMSASVLSKTSRSRDVRAAGSSFYLAMRIMPPAQSARRCLKSTRFAVRSTISPTRAAPRDARLAQLATVARRHRRRSTPHGWRRSISPARGCVADFELRREDFLAVIDGMEMDVTLDIRAPDWRRSISIATAWPARSGGLACACSAWRRPRPRARASSGPRAAADQHPARPRRGRRDRSALSAAGGVARRRDRSRPTRRRARQRGDLREACAPVVARARTHFARPTRSWRAPPRGVVRAPRIMATAYRADLSNSWSRAAWRRAALRASSCAARCCSVRAALRAADDAAPGSHHRRRTGRPLGRGRPRLARRSGCRPRGDRTGRRPLPLLFRPRARDGDRQRQSSHAVRQPRDARLSRRHRRARPSGRASPTREFPVRRSRDGKRWTVRANDGPIPWWIFDPRRRPPGTRLREYLALTRPPASGGAGRDHRRSHPLRRARSTTG